MDLEETLNKVVELAREELSIVRKRGEERTPARDHGHDFHEMVDAADRLDHYAHQLRHLHDAELGKDWRKRSASD
jgi:type VI protein secretion system component VasF